jgi:PEP-CTERM motif
MSLTSEVAFIDPLLSYNPTSDGAIASIDASYDRKATLDYSATIPYIFRAVIEQDNMYYVTNITLSTPSPFTFSPNETDGWVHLDQLALVATDFSLFDFSTGAGDASQHPNLSGDPLTFGVETLTASGTTSDGGVLNLTADYDNLSFILSPVPQPATLSFFAFGLGALGLLGWRRKRKAKAVGA